MKTFLFVLLTGLLFNALAHAVSRPVRLAAFDHKKLSPATQCVKCHTSDMPDDNLHRLIQADCSACHRTGGWKPALADSTALQR